MAQVQAVQQDLAHLKATATAASIVSYLAAEPILADLAKSSRLAVSDQQAIDMLTKIGTDSGVDASDYSFAPATVAFARSAAEWSKLQSSPNAKALAAEYQKRLAAADVTLNPRLGQPDAEGNQVAYPFPWLATSSSAS